MGEWTTRLNWKGKSDKLVKALAASQESLKEDTELLQTIRIPPYEERDEDSPDSNGFETCDSAAS